MPKYKHFILLRTHNAHVHTVEREPDKVKAITLHCFALMQQINFQGKLIEPVIKILKYAIKEDVYLKHSIYETTSAE